MLEPDLIPDSISRIGLLSASVRHGRVIISNRGQEKMGNDSLPILARWIAFNSRSGLWWQIGTISG
jgi:hypothetical protein